MLYWYHIIDVYEKGYKPSKWKKDLNGECSFFASVYFIIS